jgi:hypothetical protein
VTGHGSRISTRKTVTDPRMTAPRMPHIEDAVVNAGPADADEVGDAARAVATKVNKASDHGKE